MENKTLEFYTQEMARVSKLFGKKHKDGFYTALDLAEWYGHQLASQKEACYYCETSIHMIRYLIEQGKLKPRKTGYGWRGSVLEIDKKNNELGYNPENCVLACLYCNNDKSYTWDGETYKKFFGEARKAFFNHLLNN